MKVIKILSLAAWTRLARILDILNTCLTEAIATAADLVGLSENQQAYWTLVLNCTRWLLHKLTVITSLMCGHLESELASTLVFMCVHVHEVNCYMQTTKGYNCMVICKKLFVITLIRNLLMGTLCLFVYRPVVITGNSLNSHVAVTGKKRTLFLSLFDHFFQCCNVLTTSVSIPKSPNLVFSNS